MNTEYIALIISQASKFGNADFRDVVQTLCMKGI